MHVLPTRAFMLWALVRGVRRSRTCLQVVALASSAHEESADVLPFAVSAALGVEDNDCRPSRSAQ